VIPCYEGRTFGVFKKTHFGTVKSVYFRLGSIG
jgi:hypothetical protein